MVDFGLYSESGGRRVTIVDGNSWVGRYAPDGSLNIAASDGSGLYHACGAINYTAAEDMTTFGRYAPDGSLYVSFTLGTFGLYAPNGALRVDTGLFTPADLGDKLLGRIMFWNDEVRILSGSTVSGIYDPVAGVTFTQPTALSRPTLSASGHWAQFDGNDDFMAVDDFVYASGNTPCEVWALVSQDALVSDTNTRYLYNSGGSAGATFRGYRRTSNGAVSALSGVVGDGGSLNVVSGPATQFSGKHVARLVVGATESTIHVDGIAGSALPVIPATSTTRTRIGATASGTPGNYWLGHITEIYVTQLLTPEEVSSLAEYNAMRLNQNIGTP